MKLFSTILTSFAVLASIPLQAHSNSTYPAKTINITVPYTPGGTTDFLARRLAEVLSEKFNQAVVVENRPGAGTAVAASYISRQKPDGHHLLVASNATLAINPYLGTPLNYDPNDFEAISLLITVPNVVVGRIEADEKSLKDWFNTAKSDKNAVSYGSMGVGTSNHIGMEAVLNSNQANILHVPYKGSAPALNDLFGGHVDMVVDTLVATLPHIKAGKMQPLAVLSSQSPKIISIPTAQEAAGVDINTYSWFGLVAPKGTPKEIIQTLNKNIVEALQDEQLKKQLEDVGVEIIGSSEEEFSQFVNDQYTMYGDLIKKHSISVTP